MGGGIVGRWRIDPDDREALRLYGDVSLEFSPDGGLYYSVLSGDRRQIVSLTYRIEGDILITDQPSRPAEERTRFEITPDGKLVLYYVRRASRYLRVSDTEASPVSYLN